MELCWKGRRPGDDSRATGTGQGGGQGGCREHAVLLTPLTHSMVLMSAGQPDECLGSII